MKTVILSVLVFLSFNTVFGQIVQPGQLEIIVYPGAQLDNIDDVESKIDTKKEIILFEDFTIGELCINKSQCYDSLEMNIDILNRYIVIKKENGRLGHLSFSFLYSLKIIENNSVFQLIKAKSDEQPMLSEILFEKDGVLFYKKHFVKKLQANYRPEFDTGSKEPTFEEDFTLEFVDELGNHYSFSKIRKRILKRSLNPESVIYKEYIKLNKVKNTSDFINALKKAY